MKRLTPVSRELRNNLTDAETHLWYALRFDNLGVKFRRQGVIGKYIVDFVCFERKLIVEVDGGQHNLNQRDRERDQWLESQGFKVLRFWNNEVLRNREGMVEHILKFLNPPSPALPTKWEGNLKEIHHDF